MIFRGCAIRLVGYDVPYKEGQRLKVTIEAESEEEARRKDFPPDTDCVTNPLISVSFMVESAYEKVCHPGFNACSV